MTRGKAPAYQYAQQSLKASLQTEWSHPQDKNLERWRAPMLETVIHTINLFQFTIVCTPR